ncbi:MAG TPA: phosphatidate cytidylyltransferase [Planctomycetota bacterium]|nr:phosphatidate cytidylyltransferase [Planctomycetota bacterium]
MKDSGRFLPEFGGALDMVDSFILSAPVAVWLVLGRF